MYNHLYLKKSLKSRFCFLAGICFIKIAQYSFSVFTWFFVRISVTPIFHFTIFSALLTAREVSEWGSISCAFAVSHLKSRVYNNLYCCIFLYLFMSVVKILLHISILININKRLFSRFFLLFYNLDIIFNHQKKTWSLVHTRGTRTLCLRKRTIIFNNYYK